MAGKNILLRVLKREIYTGHFFNFIILFKEIFIDKEYDVGASLDDKVVFDVGANVGLFSLWINSRFKNVKLHAFEPDLLQKEVLTQNLPFAKLNFCAVGETKGSLDLNIYPNASGFNTSHSDLQVKIDNMHFLIRFLLRFVTKNQKKISVPVITLKDYMEMNNILCVDLCKIDVEGFESEVLKGLGDFLPKVKSFIIEVETFRKGNLEQILQILNEYEFKVIRKMRNCEVYYFYNK